MVPFLAATGTYGYADAASMKMRITPQFKRAYPFMHNIAPVETSGGQLGVVHKNGHVYTAAQKISALAILEDNVVIIKTADARPSYYLADAHLNVKSNPYDRLEFLDKNLYKATSGTGADTRQVLVNGKGKILTKDAYNEIGMADKKGYRIVRLGNEEGIINKKGKEVKRLCKGHYTGMADGIYVFRDAEGDIALDANKHFKNWKYDSKWAYKYPLADKYLLVSNDSGRKYSIVDRKNTILYTYIPANREDMKSRPGYYVLYLPEEDILATRAENGLMEIRRREGDRWNLWSGQYLYTRGWYMPQATGGWVVLYDSSGSYEGLYALGGNREVLPRIYNAVSRPTSKGMVVAYKNGMPALYNVNTTTAKVLPGEYERMEYLRGRLAPPVDATYYGEPDEDLIRIYKAGKWGLMDGEGKVLILPKYDEMGDFYNGIAEVSLQGKRFYIDTDGREMRE